MSNFKNESCTYLSWDILITSEKVFKKAQWWIGRKDTENKGIIILGTVAVLNLLAGDTWKKMLWRSGSCRWGRTLSAGLGQACYWNWGRPGRILWPKHHSAPFWKAAVHLKIPTANQYFMSYKVFLFFLASIYPFWALPQNMLKFRCIFVHEAFFNCKWVGEAAVVWKTSLAWPSHIWLVKSWTLMYVPRSPSTAAGSALYS